MRFLFTLSLVFGVACGTPADADGDGFDSFEAGGIDCDDSDPDVNPGAEETCFDGTDNDCDGGIDEAGQEATDWYPDADGDGYGPLDFGYHACLPLNGSDTRQGGDCDDNAPNAFPGGIEECDGLDNDCNGWPDDAFFPDAVNWYYDDDGDGYGGTDFILACGEAAEGYSTQPLDCDDADASVNPGAAEVCNNGIDDDCTGATPDAC